MRIVIHKGDRITVETADGEHVTGRVREHPPLGSVVQLDIEPDEDARHN